MSTFWVILIAGSSFSFFPFFFGNPKIVSKSTGMSFTTSYSANPSGAELGILTAGTELSLIVAWGKSGSHFRLHYGILLRAPDHDQTQFYVGGGNEDKHKYKNLVMDRFPGKFHVRFAQSVDDLVRGMTEAYPGVSTNHTIARVGVSYTPVSHFIPSFNEVLQQEFGNIPVYVGELCMSSEAVTAPRTTFCLDSVFQLLLAMGMSHSEINTAWQDVRDVIFPYACPKTTATTRTRTTTTTTTTTTRRRRRRTTTTTTTSGSGQATATSSTPVKGVLLALVIMSVLILCTLMRKLRIQTTHFEQLEKRHETTKHELEGVYAAMSASQKAYAALNASEVPSFWRLEPGRDQRRFEVDGLLKQSLLDLMQATDVGGFMRSIEILTVETIQNNRIWTQYCHAREELIAEFAENGRPASVADSGQDGWLHADSLLAEVNEVWAWHGTSAAVVEAVERTGFDERLSKLEGFYGAGCYFAVNSNKSDQYTGQGEKKVMLYCRLALGHIFYTDRLMKKERAPPEMPGSNFRYTSVVAEPGPKARGDGQPPHQQVHKELVVFNGRLVYPQYVITYRKLPAGP